MRASRFAAVAALLLICIPLLFTGVVLFLLAVRGSQRSAGGRQTQINARGPTGVAWTALAASEVLRASLCSIAGERRSISPRTASTPVAAQPGRTTPGPDLTPWQPDESWPGDAQHDPRLDQTVRFWGAGISLRDVFAAVRDQTGVEIGFRPSGDDNERICVNLYLNPEEPPTLRELMAQLSWATDCGFGFTEDAAGICYCLMSTSIANGVVDDLQRDQQDHEAARLARWEREKAALLKAVAANFEEYRRTLSLSDEELIAHYSGVDDMLLLNMLDPARRAGTTFVCELPKEEMELLLGGDKSIRRHWREWEPCQQVQLVEALGIEERHLTGGGVEVTVVGANSGWISVQAVELGPQGEMFCGTPFATCDTMVAENALLGRHDLNCQEAIALRRLLGEDITPQEERAFRRQWRAAHERAVIEEERRELEAQTVGLCCLSHQAERSLLSTRLALSPRGRYALWQIQEATAKASGMSVVSDCFWQPPQSPDYQLRVLFPDAAEQTTALALLTVHCRRRHPRHRLLRSGDASRMTGWQWGDAGRFLRFRSVHRDVARASLLPRHVLEQMDDLLQPVLDEAADSSLQPEKAEVRVEADLYGWIAAQLDDLQIMYGGHLVYGGLSCEANMSKHALRARILGTMHHPPLFRFLGSLSAEQWEEARGLGLRWADDLTPDQQSSSMREVVERNIEGPIGDVLVKVDESEAVLDANEGGPIPGLHRLRLLVDGSEYGRYEFPSTITVPVPRGATTADHHTASEAPARVG